ncbi:MAG TPA: hypothetical protein VGH68_05900, partial [Paraburkholderia sp.]
LAQTYRQLHEWQHAYFHYRQYLIAKPNALNRVEVEDFIEQMKNHMDEEDRAARADFNHRADGTASQSLGGVAQSPPAVAQTPAAPPAQTPPASVAPASSATPRDQVPSDARVASDAASRSSPASPTESAPGPTSEIASTPAAPTAQSSGAAVATDPGSAVASQSPPVVRAPQPVPAAAAPSQKPEFVDSSPGPLVIEKHTSAWRYTGYAMIGVGLVAGGVAFAMHGSAQSAADQFNGKYQAGALTAADTKLRDDSESKGKLATESLIAGIALVATGGALTIAF